MIRYKCGNCGVLMESPDTLAGQFEICPGCRASVKVPTKAVRKAGHRGQESTPPAGPVGIRGWLILPAVGMVGTPLSTVAGIGQWMSYLQNGLPFMPRARGTEAFLLSVIVIAIVFLCFQIYAAVVFFEKATCAPTIIICLLLANFIMTLVVTAWALILFDEADVRYALVSGINAAIWVPYFVKSKRVKATFVQPSRVTEAVSFWRRRLSGSWNRIDESDDGE